MADDKSGLIRIVVFEAVCRRDQLDCVGARQDGKNLDLKPDVSVRFGQVLRWWLGRRWRTERVKLQNRVWPGQWDPILLMVAPLTLLHDYV